jgi:hypothetical protein
VRSAATQSCNLPLLLRIQRCKPALSHSEIEAETRDFSIAARPLENAARRKRGVDLGEFIGRFPYPAARRAQDAVTATVQALRWEDSHRNELRWNSV